VAQGNITVPYIDGLALLTAAFILLWLRLAGQCPSQRFARAALTVTGYLRRRPDQTTEARVRHAFAELDRDLDAILGQQVG
jgi:hypothetical protein